MLSENIHKKLGMRSTPVSTQISHLNKISKKNLDRISVNCFEI